MKIAVSGKGGSGKTTLVGLLARHLARGGRRVLAIDADPNPNLAVALGLPRDLGPELVPIPRDMAEWREDGAGRAYVHLHLSLEEIERRYGIAAPDDVTLLITGRIEQAGIGCMCQPHAIARGLIAQVHRETGGDVVTDMEAGLEHLSRGTVEHVDALLVVMEPYYRSLETGMRARDLAHELGVPRVVAIGNKVRTEEEQRAVTEFCARHDLDLLAIVPYDPACIEADRLGCSTLDVAEDSAASRSIAALAATLEQRIAPAA